MLDFKCTLAYNGEREQRSATRAAVWHEGARLENHIDKSCIRSGEFPVHCSDVVNKIWLQTLLPNEELHLCTMMN